MVMSGVAGSAGDGRQQRLQAVKKHGVPPDCQPPLLLLASFMGLDSQLQVF